MGGRTATGHKGQQNGAQQFKEAFPLVYQPGWGWGGWTLSPHWPEPHTRRRKSLTSDSAANPHAFLWASTGCFWECLPAKDKTPCQGSRRTEPGSCVCAERPTMHSAAPQQRMNPAPGHAEADGETLPGEQSVLEGGVTPAAVIRGGSWRSCPLGPAWESRRALRRQNRSGRKGLAGGRETCLRKGRKVRLKGVSESAREEHSVPEGGLVFPTPA